MSHLQITLALSTVIKGALSLDEAFQDKKKLMILQLIVKVFVAIEKFEYTVINEPEQLI